MAHEKELATMRYEHERKERQEMLNMFIGAVGVFARNYRSDGNKDSGNHSDSNKDSGNTESSNNNNKNKNHT